ncbi:MAG: hypothetical protein KIT09_30835 [Bryobacteraceae bacterium]|nr:hypothetical protein [Bryobacteraceae bacterium]
MAVALLDVNVLLALAWPHHVHHRAAREWFAAHRSQGWATCPFTQAAFVRLSSQPAAVKVAVTVQDAMRTLETAVAAAEHVFWPNEHGIPEILPEIRARLWDTANSPMPCCWIWPSARQGN